MTNIDIFQKEYDITDWEDFHGGVMVNMVLLQYWINWIMSCVETVDYSIIVNENVVVLLLWVQFYVMEVLYFLAYSLHMHKDCQL